MNEIVKISVAVITYNQQDCIVKALDSLTCQKDWIYEIIVSDDCSKDNTWQVVNEYAKQYPDLVKPYQNVTNLGIYGNMISAYNRAKGNVIATLSGDDQFMPTCFEKAVKFITEQGVLGSVFNLYCDRRRHFVDNRPDYTFKNNLVTSHRRLSYVLRHCICEPTFFSPQLLDRCQPPLDLGKCGDFYWSLARMYYSDVNIYLNITSIVYNAGIGVSVTSSFRERRESYELVFNKIIEENEMRFGRKDLLYVKYLLHRNNSYFTPSWRSLFTTTYSYFKSIDLSLVIQGLAFIEHAKYLIRYLSYLRYTSR